MKLLIIAILSLKAFAAVPFNSTIMLFNEDDLDECKRQIDKAMSFHNQKLHFLVSVYADLEKKKVTRYYLKNKAAKIEHARNNNIKRFQKKTINCIQNALSQTKEVYVTVQLNHVTDHSNFRNYFDYDPLEKIKGYSLYDIAFKPFNKLNSKLQPRVFLALTGEMGLSIKTYPESYSKIIKRLPSKLNIGISINFNQSFGSFLDFNLELNVLNEFDFIGFSAYAMMPAKCRARDYKRNVEEFIKDLRGYGLNKKNPRIHITETGIGGGAPLAALSSRMPYKGIYGAYKLANDPWQDPSYSKVRKRFYQCLLEFLKKTDLVQAAFLWNADSWDVQGLYPYSSKYKDDEIIKAVTKHNNSMQ